MAALMLAIELGEISMLLQYEEKMMGST